MPDWNKIDWVSAKPEFAKSLWKRPVRNSAPEEWEGPDAEHLLRLAESLHDGGSKRIVVPAEEYSASALGLAKTALAVRFSSLSAVTRFRAIAEGWDRTKIIRECC